MIAPDEVRARILEGAGLPIGGFMPPACWSK
jgi:hypothetical protein